MTVPKYQFVDDRGDPARGWESIVPILRVEETGQLVCFATGFFIHVGGIIVTAAHVVKEIVNDDGTTAKPLRVLHYQGNNHFGLRPVAKATIHKVADVAILGLHSEMDPATKQVRRNKVLAMTSSTPPVGTPVFSWAFPNSIHMHHGSQSSIRIEPRLYEGQITAEFQNGRDRVVLPGPCYETTLGISGGASGGPVFTESGLVFAVNSTGIDGTDVAYVSHVQPLGGLPLQGYQGRDGIHRETVRISELISMGEVLVK